MSDMPDLTALFSMLSNSQNTTGNNANSMKEAISNLMSSSSNQNVNNISKTSKDDIHFSANNMENAKQNNSNADTQKNDSFSDNDINSFGSMNMPDMETMMKIISVMKNANKPSPSSELLKSLKPFLNETRKEKIDQYIKIIGVTKAFEAFNELDKK